MCCFIDMFFVVNNFNSITFSTMTITILKWRDISRNDDNKNSTQYKVAALMNVENKCVVLQIKKMTVRLKRLAMSGFGFKFPIVRESHC